MATDAKQPIKPARLEASVATEAFGDAVLLTVTGLVNEQFEGFGRLDNPKAVVIDVAGLTRLTSFGVRQWLRSMEALPKACDVYLLGCPTFFVDQLNMVLNFGGPARVLTAMAPYTCPMCGTESGEVIDVLATRGQLVKGGAPVKQCSRCGGKLDFDETPESYFSFVSKYAATNPNPAAAQLLNTTGLYRTNEALVEKPPRIIKLVHGSVTYFRIIGAINSMFRARPFLVGAEGEVIIDLAEVDRVESTGMSEWKRLLKSLVGQVPAVSLIDVGEAMLATGAPSFAGRNIYVASVRLPYRCSDCHRIVQESYALDGAPRPLSFPDHVCSTCGGTTANQAPPELLAPVQNATAPIPPASAKLISRRDEVLSRALTDANVAQAGGAATASLTTDDTILGKYKIQRRLSSGGMAEVYVAKQIGLGGFEKQVALKRIQSKLLESRHLAIDMFLNEAKIAGRLLHPNIVQVLDVGEVAGSLYLAMEYVHGRDLRELLKKLRSHRMTLPLAEVCYIVREIAQALHHAYWSTDLDGNRLSVVHRDVSPHNVILGYDGTVKLLDFGVAMSAVTEQEQKMVVGKWLYMSPEHAANQPSDHRSDLFSLGVVAYLSCTGSLPFSGSDPKEIVRKIRVGTYRPLDPQYFPPGLIDLIHRMLAPNPADRPQTGQEVVAALDEITRGHQLACSPPSISALVSNLFPDEQLEAPSTVELVRVRTTIPPGPTSGSLSGYDTTQTPRGFTPNHGPADASVSLSPRRRSDAFDVDATVIDSSPPEFQPEHASIKPRRFVWISIWISILVLMVVLVVIALLR